MGEDDEDGMNGMGPGVDLSDLFAQFHGSGFGGRSQFSSFGGGGFGGGFGGGGFPGGGFSSGGFSGYSSRSSGGYPF